MNRKLVSLFLAVMLLCIPSYAAGLEDYEVVIGNFNTGGVQNEPEYYPYFTLKGEGLYVHSITTYHWNGGNGAAPGKISIKTGDGETVGTWQASGRLGNTYWDVFPQMELGEGEYYITDSGVSTWSWNGESKQRGFTEIRGYYTEPDPSNRLEDAGYENAKYICSDWALAEIEKADQLGLIPEQLSRANLTKEITRAEFAALSVKVYEKMNHLTVSSSGLQNPFTDTADQDVLKAYALELTNGIGNNKFGPDNRLTREQGATMLARAYKKTVYKNWSLTRDANYPLETGSSRFADDGQISDWAKNSVYFMSGSGILNGVGGNKFDPSSKMTREQAILVAARMAANLDTAERAEPAGHTGDPGGSGSGENNNSGNSGNSGGSGNSSGNSGNSGGNSGNSGGASSSGFTDGVKVEVNEPGIAYETLRQDDGSTDLFLSGMPSKPVTLTIPMAAPTEDKLENVIRVGIPYVDGNGQEGFAYAIADSKQVGNEVVATVDIKALSESLEDILFKSGEEQNIKNNTERYLKYQAAKLKTIVPTVAVNLIADNEYVVKSDNDLFAVYIPKKYWSKEVAPSNKLNALDALNIGNDLESLLKYYKDKGYTVKRTDWPMKVSEAFFKSDAYFSGGQMYIYYSAIDNGYNRDGAYGSSKKLYTTLGHELFHFIQREAVNKLGAAGWFDEAAGTYYELELGLAKGWSTVEILAGSNYSTDGPRQYGGIFPYDATVNVLTYMEDGYGRAGLIEYLMLNYGSDFLKKYYDKGILVSSSLCEDRIAELAGKTTAELAYDYYKQLLTTNKLHGVANNPSLIYEKTYETDENYAKLLRNYISDFTMTGQDESASVSVYRFGAHFASLRMSEKLSANATAFSITVPDGVRAMLIGLTSNDVEMDKLTSAMKLYESSGGKIENVPIDATRYLLVLVNTDTSLHYTNVTYNITYQHFNSGEVETNWPRKQSEFPKIYNGTIYWFDRYKGTFYKQKSFKGWAMITLEPSTTITISTDDDFKSDADYKAFSLSGASLNYNKYTGTLTNSKFNIQLGEGEYVDSKELAEYLLLHPDGGKYKDIINTPFASGIGSAASNAIRVHAVDHSGNFVVFVGSGTNGDFYDGGEINITQSAGSELETADIHRD